ncbi:flagellar biosynthesis protein FlhA [Celeribacter marinus]|uniref:Flagellar biosynthesis protein FlhA n=1 Tax=Celeribacter marinus TaxID=1397108 RepID=A0A0N9ZVV6_9RHOB|nr:flagellar biosynthesis protein FlhA [Celeribacter marinus]
MLPIGILVLVAMMVLPLPVFLLDTFFVVNIVLSLLILMVALHTHRPLDFSSFPNLILIATVLRLALNVASTRVVLSEGHTGADAAGQVIKAFGEFVVAGNYAVGIFVFIILVIINLVVITKGAGRVSEVSARFTLDAMPGKQMAIDADLNAGIMTPEEATARRQEVADEADFYGSMDGASKFVKGDAIAGLLILAINIVGGLIIGVAQHQMAVADAAQSYILLSIGDGLVAQIPSLLLSIATAIIVTRVSSTQDMAQHIGGQVNLSRAWTPTAAVIFILGLVPGMPNQLFMLFAAAAAAAAYFARKSEDLSEAEADLEAQDGGAEEATDSETVLLADVTDYSAVSMQLGYGLISLVDEEQSGPLVSRITGIRREVSRGLGFVIPGVRIRDDLALEPNQYRIRIGQTIVGEDVAYPDRKLALPGDGSLVKIEGIEVKDPSFGMDAVWIRPQQQAEAEANDYVVIEPDSVISTHLSQLLNKHAADLIGQDDVQALLDQLGEASPNLVKSIVPKLVPLHVLTLVLRRLLSERIPISDLRRILEGLSNLVGPNMGPNEMAEALRPKLVPLLIQQVSPLGTVLPLMTLTPELEQLMLRTVRQNGEDGLVLEGSLAEQLMRSINDSSEKLSAAGRPTIMVVAPQIRRVFSDFVRAHIPDMIILSFTELPENRRVEVYASIGSFDALGAEGNPSAVASELQTEPETV